jgi:hypothetical protein
VGNDPEAQAFHPRFVTKLKTYMSFNHSLPSNLPKGTILLSVNRRERKRLDGALPRT